MRRNRGSVATPVDEVLVDGQLLDVAGGLRVLHTPGHSPGHISLLHEPTGVLITGDAIWNMLRPDDLVAADALHRRRAEPAYRRGPG